MTAQEFDEIHEAWAEVMAAYAEADAPYGVEPEEMIGAFGPGAVVAAKAR